MNTELTLDPQFNPQQADIKKPNPPLPKNHGTRAS